MIPNVLVVPFTRVKTKDVENVHEGERRDRFHFVLLSVGSMSPG